MIEEVSNTPIYARDLRPEILNDTFMGKGFEKALMIANKREEDLVVGYWTKKWKRE